MPPTPPPPVKRPASVVRAHRPTLLQRAAARAIWAIIRVLAFSLRLKVEDGSGMFADATDHGPVIFAIWHNRLALSMMVHTRVLRRLRPRRSMAALVSASKDGALLSGILENFGVLPVRGSTSRRGRQALFELAAVARSGHDLAITPDGPRGPCYQAHEGIIFIAQLTGHPIVPVSTHLNWKWRARSWDRFQIPLPFSHFVVRTALPVRVPTDASAELRERLRLQLQATLCSLAED